MFGLICAMLAPAYTVHPRIAKSSRQNRVFSCARTAVLTSEPQTFHVEGGDRLTEIIHSNG